MSLWFSAFLSRHWQTIFVRVPLAMPNVTPLLPTPLPHWPPTVPSACHTVHCLSLVLRVSQVKLNYITQQKHKQYLQLELKQCCQKEEADLVEAEAAAAAEAETERQQQNRSILFKAQTPKPNSKERQKPKQKDNTTDRTCNKNKTTTKMFTKTFRKCCSGACSTVGDPVLIKKSQQ